MENPQFTLGFDTADAHIALALLQNDTLLDHRHAAMAKGQGEQLFPMIEALLKDHNLGFDALGCIGVGVGPGNFTGIRLGVAGARGLAMALKIPALGVSTLSALAHGQSAPCMVALDARRDHIYVQYFNHTKAKAGPAHIARADLAPAGTDLHLIGPLAAELKAQIGGRVCEAIYPLAIAIARIARDQQIGGETKPPAPLYLRQADADLPASPPVTILS